MRDGNLTVASPEPFAMEWKHEFVVPNRRSRDARNLLRLGSIDRELKLALYKWDVGLEGTLGHGKTFRLWLRLVRVIHGCTKSARL